MKLLIPVLLAVLATVHCQRSTANGSRKQWALLAAGSNTWDNYRHQADIAHAYQILIRRGIPADNIIVFMYDDIAHNPSNPTPGVVINKPDGPDVWKGVKIDYKGADVNPETFLAVLAGNKEAVKGKGTGRVIESDSNDDVFVNFADHGGPGILCFIDDLLHVADLTKTIKKLTDDKKYNKLVFYVEACESGSMFADVLPKNTKVLASTAANPTEPSWGCYCSYKNYPCLGDVYSVKWMEYVDTAPSLKQTLLEQYDVIKKAVTTSHVSLYGDLGIDKTPAADFLGHKNKPAGHSKHVSDNDKVDSRDATLHYYKRMAQFGRNKQEKMEYAHKVKEVEEKRKVIDEMFNKVVGELSSNDEDLRNEIENTRKTYTEDGLNCQKDLYTHFSNKCAKITKNPYVIRHLYKLANICEMSTYHQLNAFEAIDKTCNGDFPELMNIV